MKKFTKYSFIALFSLSLVFSMAIPSTTHAATTPDLGVAATFGILSSTFTRNIGLTAITGDLGYTTLSGSGTHSVTGATYIGGGAGDATYQAAGTAQATALTALNAQACTFTFAAGAIDLAADTTHGDIGVYTPGVYCTQTADGAMSIGTAGITLSGAGTYIFRTSGPSNALTSVANSPVNLAGGASACDVFWTPTAATTLGANSTFKGTVIDNSGITVGSTVAWIGRALAFGGTVTTDTDTITVPTGCAVAAVSQSTQQEATINVVKTVTNDSGGTKLSPTFLCSSTTRQSFQARPTISVLPLVRIP